MEQLSAFGITSFGYIIAPHNEMPLCTLSISYSLLIRGKSAQYSRSVLSMHITAAKRKALVKYSDVILAPYPSLLYLGIDGNGAKFTKSGMSSSTSFPWSCKVVSLRQCHQKRSGDSQKSVVEQNCMSRRAVRTTLAAHFGTPKLCMARLIGGCAILA